MKNLIRNTRIINLFAFVFVAAGIATACNDDTDTIKPEIELTQPADESAYSPGDTIRFVCTFSDNEMLKSYKIEIHDNFDGHEHKSVTSESENAWHYANEWSFEGVLQQYTADHYEIAIPDSVNGQPIAHGHYHFGVHCADAAGNENHVFVEIEIE